MTLQEIPSESFRERSIPVLETERLVLRAPRLGDAKIGRSAGERPPHRREHGTHSASVPRGRRRGLHRRRPISAARRYSSSRCATARVIGACGFTQVDRHPPEIGYWLGVKHWGKGYATEAVRAMIDHVFTDLDCEAIQSAARVTNPASRRVLEKCGFQWTGAGLLRIRAHRRARRRSTASGSTAACGPR